MTTENTSRVVAEAVTQANPSAVVVRAFAEAITQANPPAMIGRVVVEAIYSTALTPLQPFAMILG
jgi:hypothetical protein